MVFSKPIAVHFIAYLISIKPTHNGTVFILDLSNLATKQGNVAFTEHYVL